MEIAVRAICIELCKYGIDPSYIIYFHSVFPYFHNHIQNYYTITIGRITFGFTNETLLTKDRKTFITVESTIKYIWSHINSEYDKGKFNRDLTDSTEYELECDKMISEVIERQRRNKLTIFDMMS